jgi:hypothetical protein
VTEKALLLFGISILLFVIAALEIAFFDPSVSLIIGIITILLGIFVLVDALGLLMGQQWALTLSGWSNRPWAQAPDVKQYFGLPTTPATAPPYATAPTYSTAPANVSALGPNPTPPAASPACPTCGQPLRYIEQYGRWYCDREQKYI